MAKQYGLINMKKKSEDARTKRETKMVIDRALEEDPNIFAYDEIYDDIHKERDQTAGVSAASDDGAKKKSKFIGNLKLNAEKRKIAEEHRIDRKIEREREAEGDQFADKESFVTEAYRQKLLERKLYEEREKKEMELEELMDVRKQEHGMTAYYRNYLSQRVGEKVDMKKEKFLDKVTKDLKKQLLSKNEDEQRPKNVEFKKSTKSSHHSKRQRRSSSSSDEEDVVVRDLRKNKERLKTNHEREGKKQAPEKGGEVAETAVREHKESDDRKEVEQTLDLKENKESKNSQSGGEVQQPADKKLENDDKPVEPEKPKLTLREILSELFRKRCVGDEFEEQQRRYFERRANCLS